MKKLLMIMTAFAMGLPLYAQVKPNVTKESTTVTTKVNDGTRERKVVKTESRTAQQEIELQNAESKELNKNIKPTPVQVTSSTTLSGDGIPTQEIDRSSYYTMNGQRYQFSTDRAGYRVSTDNNQNYGVLRKTSNNNYIYRSGTTTSYGYFDGNGNFIVETYDDKTDGVTVQTFTRVRQ